MAIPAASTAQIISITIAPPELPVYEQPEIPAPGYIWTPGYWAYGPDGYFWVPGTWVEPPAVGLLWTPGYWGWHDGNYGWNAGYWGPHIGFYGGVNYGYGYGGVLGGDELETLGQRDRFIETALPGRKFDPGCNSVTCGSGSDVIGSASSSKG